MKYIHLFTIFIFLLSCKVTYANPIKYKIDKVIEENAHNINIGIKIVNLRNNHIIYERNPHHYFNFASSLKILTTANAIEFFGEDYEFKNKLVKLGEDIYLDIGDDPSFEYIDLEKLFQELKLQNINNIKGNFYIIKRDFKLPSLSPDKVISDSIYCYGAPVSRTHINKNCFPLTVEPCKVGQKTKVSSPYSNLFKIINTSLTIKDNSGKARILRNVEKETIKVSGALNISSTPLKINPVITDNINHIKLFINNFIKQNNIKLHGKILTTDISRANNSSKGQVIAENKKDIKEIYKLILQKSDNYLSDYLFQLMSNKRNFDEWFEAGQHFKQYAIKMFNIDFADAVIMDGSGISRLNMLTPKQMSDLLDSIAQKKYFSNFKNYLIHPPQEESTIKNCFQDFPGELYVKTGSMRGIYSLVGYLEKGDELYSFVIVFNNATGNREKYMHLDELILKQIVD